MINNTNSKKWDRIQAKTLDAQFTAEMIHGLNCSPFEASIMAQKVHEIYSPLLNDPNAVKPGQVLASVVAQSVSPAVPLADAAKVTVLLTLHDPVADILIRREKGVPGLRRKRISRMAEEAFQQGGLLTLEDLSLLLNAGVRTLVRDLGHLRKQNVFPPLRSLVKDIGRAVTHRAAIVALWLAGREYSEIADRLHHSVSAVANYVDKYRRCAVLFLNGFDLDRVAMVVRISTSLAKEYQVILQKSNPVPHRKQELDDWIKKTVAIPFPEITRRARS